MPEIKINISNLGNAVIRLNNMAANWSARNTAPPKTVGGGKTVNELEEIAQIYTDLNSNLVTLASTTASFFSNIKDSYEASDKKAAVGIKQGK